MKSRTTLGAALAAAIASTALFSACGLDDTVALVGGGGTGGGGSDATFGVDGTASGDGSTSSGDGTTTTTGDAGSDGDADLVHVDPDSGDPDDADLSDATVTDAGCDNGQFACTTGNGTVCLNDCVLCPSNHAACPGTKTCGSGCGSCSGSPLECYRSGFLGAQVLSCVDTPATCAGTGGNPLFCGSIVIAYVDCPGKDQVCVGNQCLTCGETGTVNQECSPGSKGKCKNPGPVCQ